MFDVPFLKVDSIEPDCLCLALLVSSEESNSGLDKHRGQLSE